jgi:hypothetical protein
VLPIVKLDRGLHINRLKETPKVLQITTILRTIASAPWYVPNITLHEDLNVPLVKEVIKQRGTRYHNKIEGHVNVLIQPLLEPHNEKRLKRNWPADIREG